MLGLLDVISNCSNNLHAFVNLTYGKFDAVVYNFQYNTNASDYC